MNSAMLLVPSQSGDNQGLHIRLPPGSITELGRLPPGSVPVHEVDCSQAVSATTVCIR